MQTFANLDEAVRFLARAIETGDHAALAAACHEQLPAARVLERLRERHQETPLPALYAGREFPEDGQQFKLGGHARELGHIPIDFARSAAGWELQRIWMCR